jgi:hypothetical protein
MGDGRHYEFGLTLDGDLVAKVFFREGESNDGRRGNGAPRETAMSVVGVSSSSRSILLGNGPAAVLDEMAERLEASVREGSSPVRHVADNHSERRPRHLQDERSDCWLSSSAIPPPIRKIS